MMGKAPLPLLAVTLLCCVAALQAYPTRRCICIRHTSAPVRSRFIHKIEVIPVSGSCRWTQIIVTRKNGSAVCIDPAAPWINALLQSLQKKNGAATAASTTPAGN